MTAPAAHTHLNYPGDRSNMEHPQLMGPNLMGEYLYTVSAEHDPETNRTRVGLRYDIDALLSGEVEVS